MHLVNCPKAAENGSPGGEWGECDCPASLRHYPPLKILSIGRLTVSSYTPGLSDPATDVFCLLQPSPVRPVNCREVAENGKTLGNQHSDMVGVGKAKASFGWSKRQVRSLYLRAFPDLGQVANPYYFGEKKHPWAD